MVTITIMAAFFNLVTLYSKFIYLKKRAQLVRTLLTLINYEEI